MSSTACFKKYSRFCNESKASCTTIQIFTVLVVKEGASMYDAIVVGGRCAGAPTALLLARKGYKVLLLDRGTFPSDMPFSNHYVHQTGSARLKRWGLLDK